MLHHSAELCLSAALISRCSFFHACLWNSLAHQRAWVDSMHALVFCQKCSFLSLVILAAAFHFQGSGFVLAVDERVSDNAG